MRKNYKWESVPAQALKQARNGRAVPGVKDGVLQPLSTETAEDATLRQQWGTKHPAGPSDTCEKGGNTSPTR